jgi:hypothetical protein
VFHWKSDPTQLSRYNPSRYERSVGCGERICKLALLLHRIQSWHGLGFGFLGATQTHQKPKFLNGVFWVSFRLLRTFLVMKRSSSCPNPPPPPKKGTTLSSVWSYFNEKPLVHQDKFADCMHCGRKVSFNRKSERVVPHLRFCTAFNFYLDQ